MIPAGFLFLLLLTDVQTSDERKCSYLEVLEHLNLTKNKEQFTMIRPVKDYRDPTNVTLDVLLYAILDVREKDQQLVPYVWIDMWWKNEFLSWNSSDFCNITKISVPSELLWKPDITIEEMTEKDRAPPNPFLIISSDGEVEITDDQVLVSACRMHVYKFPFDIQTCNLTFKSVVHTDQEIQLFAEYNSSQIYERTLKLMHNQYEWLFVNMTVHKENTNVFDFNQSVVTYNHRQQYPMFILNFNPQNGDPLHDSCTTVDVDRLGEISRILPAAFISISIKRRAGLYIINFMLPILFFVGLDLASFMISESSGEKLSFKVTVLLAVTVMQLILNDILPSSSNRIPLIASYCIGIFGLMMLSLLETVLVMHLLHKDTKVEQEKEQSLSEDCGYKEGDVSINNYYKGRTPSEVLPVAKEESSGQLMEESHDFEKLSYEMRELVKMLLNSRMEEARPAGYWKGVCKRINKGFFIFYIIALSLFLVYMFYSWTG